MLCDNSFEANVLVGTQLCSRRLLQQIIYCVGGVSVFFPLITQCDFYETKESERVEKTSLAPFTKERFTAEVIEIIASVLDENLANQQQMLLLSGFSILGFLLQSVPPEQLNMETLSALKHLFNVVANSGGMLYCFSMSNFLKKICMQSSGIQYSYFASFLHGYMCLMFIFCTCGIL